MTDEELAAIKARVEAATPGPWREHTVSGYTYLIDAPHNVRFPGIASTWEHDPNQSNNAAFIAHAREDIPALLAERAALLDVLPQVISLADETILCHHCLRDWTQMQHHAEDCPITKARALLATAEARQPDAPGRE